MDNQKIGLFIKEKRTANSLTQQQLADILNVSKNTVSRWERGLNIPDIATMQELVALLGVTTDDLLKGEKSTVNKSNHMPLQEGSPKKRTVLQVMLVICTLVFMDISYGYFSTKLQWDINSHSTTPHGLIFKLLFGDRTFNNTQGIYITKMMYMFLAVMLVEIILIIINSTTIHNKENS